MASHFTGLDYAVLFVYFGAMAAMGPIFASKAKTTEGYFLGDRSFPGWLIGFSMFATSISSITFVAYPGDGYKAAWYRMSPNYMLPIAIVIATIWFLPFFRRTQITSAYEYLEGRFGPKTRVYAASAFIFGQAIRVSMVLYLVSLLVYEMLGMNPYLCIVLGGVVTAFYTVLGGIRAVLWTDFIQAMVLWFGGLIALVVILMKLSGGPADIVTDAWKTGKMAHRADVVANLYEKEEDLATYLPIFDDPAAHGYEAVEFKEDDNDPDDFIAVREIANPVHMLARAREKIMDPANPEIVLEEKIRVRETTLGPIKGMPRKFSDIADKTVFLFLLVGLTNWLTEYSANQNVIQRYAASKSAKQARIAMWVCCAFSVPTWGLFMLLGSSLFVFFQQFPTETAMEIYTGANQAKAESILPYFVISYLPAGVTGLVIAAVLSAAMSSISSSLNGVSAVGVVDIYRRHLAKGRTDAHYTMVAKLIGAALAVIMIVGAAILMKVQTTTLQDTASVLAALTAGGLLGLYLLGFFTRTGDDRAMMLGIACTLMFTLWMALSNTKISGEVLLPARFILPIHSYYAGLFGHILMFIIGYGAGMLLPKHDRDLHNLTVWTADDKPLD